MNGIPVPDWLAYTLAAAVVLFVVGSLVYLVKCNEQLGRERAERMHPIPGSTLWCEGEPGLDVDAIAKAVQQAFDELTLIWPRAVMVERLAKWVVKVAPTETWKGRAGDVRGGECWPEFKTVQVGPSLSALAHELAHACESAVDRKLPDEVHGTWAHRGVWTADTAYRTRRGVT